MRNSVQKLFRIVTYIIIASIILAQSILGQSMSWRKLNLSSVDAFTVSSSNNLYAYSGWYRCLYKSDDRGNNWTTMQTDFPSTFIYAMEAVGADSLLWGGYEGQLFFSGDGGTTFTRSNSFNSAISAIKYKYVNNGNILIVGLKNGMVNISKDFGKNWDSKQVTSGYIWSIKIIQNRIYVCSAKGLYLSDDEGNSWQKTVIQKSDEEVFDIESDSLNVIYASVESKVYKSTNKGITWTFCFNDLVYAIKYSPEKEIFAGRFRTVDQGKTWERIFTSSYIYSINFVDTVTYILNGYTSAIFREEPGPYTGKNYFPLVIGNSWQYIGESSYSDGIRSNINYYQKLMKVVSDTLINGKQYYKVDKDGEISFYRYGADNKLYIWRNSAEMLYMDFNLISGDTFTYNNMLANVYDGYVTRFGNERFYKGYGYSEFPAMRMDRRFIDSIGLWYEDFNENGPMGYQGSWNITIGYALVAFGDSIRYYSSNNIPQIIDTPLSITKTPEIAMKFKVTHPYSRFSSSGTSLDFIQSVWVEYFYSNDDSSTKKESIDVQVLPNSTDWTVSFSLDTVLMNHGYKLYYSISAKDKALIPTTVVSPETGYYELIYDPLLSNIKNDAENHLSFNLSQNYPNPFNPTTVISWQLAVSSYVTLKIYDVLGNEVATLVNDNYSAGTYKSKFNVETRHASSLPSGVYFYQLRAGSFVQTKKMILMK
ncbi:MAG: T9SS type A sorting domain-containing protein [Ignavibacteriaceae bacterium]|nr:T9SS type A sorting domain-containing protein [Ignavibacteriaceae bacterium]